jgi:deoxynucleoside triphosphate triphosphohydrolase SAMHD1
MTDVCEKKKKLLGDLCTPDSSKTIYDVLYGPLQITRFASEIIDSSQFQRLQRMKQLGMADCIFPNAVHTRYAHSIGTYYQCKKLTERLADVTPISEMSGYLRGIPELAEYIEKNYKERDCEFDKYLQELINIAALCHDLGHGPFSHLFDDIFIEHTTLKTHKNAKHERRSQLLIEIIIKNSEFLKSRILNDHVKLIQDIIDPGPQHTAFIYQIVSNNANSLDVDKFDYITRDMGTLGIRSSFDYRVLIHQAVIINNVIAYPTESALDIQQLFQMRHLMYRKVYNNKQVIGAHLMMADVMKKINELIHISDSIIDMDRFCTYTDSSIIEISKLINTRFFAQDDKNQQEQEQEQEQNKHIINDIKVLSERFDNNNYYYPIFGFVMSDKVDFDKNQIFKEAFSQYMDDIVIFTSVAGFVSGNKSNPLDNICLYDDIKYVNGKITYIGSTIKKNKYGITNIMPDSYQEYITIIYYKKNDTQSKEKIIPQIEKYFKEYISEYLRETIINYIKI